jgi:hypothetical protein
LLSVNAHAKSFELRGLGTLQSEGPFGVPGESITVSVTLNSEDFDYVPVANPIFHYFVPNTTIPVEIVGSVSGPYPNVSPINRFLALEWEEETGGDLIALDVSADSNTTSLLNLTTTGASGFDGDVTPFNSTDLFTLFEEAMQNTSLWNRADGSAVFIGSGDNLLTLGPIQWSLIDLEETPDGDFDIDGDVDGRDFLVWQRGGSPSSLSADDLANWQANYGFGTLTAASTAVPEPTAGMLLALLAAALFRMRCFGGMR